MEVSTTNNYQVLSAQQRPSIQPVPQEPTYSNKEIYEASQGNAIRNDSGEITLTPQGQTNLQSAKAENTAEKEAASQAQKDAQRDTATDYLAHQSKKSQVEIYLSVATDNRVEIGSDGDIVSVIESLRDVQKQNNIVAAYATYQENQNPTKLAYT
jgi:hypothetical protein